MTATDLQAHIPFGLIVTEAIVIGLLVGSFLNVVVYRTPRHLSVSTPRSFCPTCDRQLAWWENIPVVSWLALRGRCHTCKQPISIRYPLVEAGTALAFALVTLAWHGTAPAIAYCALAATILAVALIEVGDLRAPLAVAATGTAIADLALVVACVWSHDWSTLLGAQLGLLTGGAAFAVLRHADPESTWSAQYGRSALVPVGCWLGGLGGLGLFPVAVGLGAGALSFLLCLGITVRQGRVAVADPPGAQTVPSTSVVGALARRPLVVAVIVASAGSLLAYR